jgi:hypothetical protein
MVPAIEWRPNISTPVDQQDQRPAGQQKAEADVNHVLDAGEGLRDPFADRG